MVKSASSYPRACGEDQERKNNVDPERELSPACGEDSRTRPADALTRRAIPAHAGKTISRMMVRAVRSELSPRVRGILQKEYVRRETTPSYPRACGEDRHCSVA